MLLEAIQKRLNELNIENVIQKINENQESLIVDYVVRKDNNVQLKYNYTIIPDMLGLTPNFINLQSFVELHSFVPVEAQKEILWMIAKVNPFLPIGAFGYFEAFNMLYWKQNNYIDATLDTAQNAEMVIAQTVFSQETILGFKPNFLAVVDGLTSAKESLEKNRWANTIFGR